MSTRDSNALTAISVGGGNGRLVEPRSGLLGSWSARGRGLPAGRRTGALRARRATLRGRILPAGEPVPGHAHDLGQRRLLPAHGVHGRRGPEPQPALPRRAPRGPRGGGPVPRRGRGGARRRAHGPQRPARRRVVVDAGLAVPGRRGRRRGRPLDRHDDRRLRAHRPVCGPARVARARATRARQPRDHHRDLGPAQRPRLPARAARDLRRPRGGARRVGRLLHERRRAALRRGHRHDDPAERTRAAPRPVHRGRCRRRGGGHGAHGRPR